MKATILFAIPVLFLVSCGNNEQPQEVPSADTITLSATPNVVGKEVVYESGGLTMKGYLAYDENMRGKRPGVIVVHEWWGHNEHSRNSANKLAAMGYTAFALDMYGDGKTASHPDDAGAFVGAVMNDFAVAKERFNAALAVLKADEHCNTEEIAAIGYCFGGGVVLNMARQGSDLDAVATFHGSIGAIEPAQPGSVKGKILVMNGADDSFLPQEAIDEFKSEMEAAQVDYEFVNYPGAIHGFTNPAADENGKKFGLPLAYSKEADQQSWEKLTTFLDVVFSGL